MTPLLRRQSYGLRRIRILEAANRGAWSRHSSLCPSRSSLESRELSLGMPSRRLWLEESLCARLDGDHSTVAGFAPPLTLRRKSMIGSRTLYSLRVLLLFDCPGPLITVPWTSSLGPSSHAQRCIAIAKIAAIARAGLVSWGLWYGA